MQNELTAMTSFLNDIDSEMTYWQQGLNDMFAFEDEVADQMALLGVIPGQCPQLDAMLNFIQAARQSVINTFTNPLHQQIGTMEDILAKTSSQLSGMLGIVNNIGAFDC